MKIIVDAMGGDNAPEEIVHGAADAARELEENHLDGSIILVGDTAVTEPLAEKYKFPRERLETVHTDVVLTMEDDPISVVRSKKDCSMAKALRILKDNGGDAAVSAGNTGALLTGASLIVRPVKGVRRPAIATILPFKPPVLLLDSGANTNVTAEYMEAWGVIGSLYMKHVCRVDCPKVGLLNNGTEEHKGTELARAAHERLASCDFVNFIGNVEASMIPFSPCDVLVTDGFTGNVTLKLIEGMGKFTFSRLRGMFTKGLASKLAYLSLKSELRTLKNDFDASEAGGAPILGLSRPVIKAHGNSDARAIYNAIRQARSFACADEFSSKMKEYAESLTANSGDARSDANEKEVQEK